LYDFEIFALSKYARNSWECRPKIRECHKEIKKKPTKININLNFSSQTSFETTKARE
jgi:hypothetical protein